MQLFRPLSVLVQLVLLLSGLHMVFGQETQPISDANRQIVTEIKTHNELMDNVEFLSDVLGPRLTGSENLRKANL
jgi:hypothetical protein